MPRPKEPSEEHEREERKRREREEHGGHAHERPEHERHEDDYERPGDKERPRRRRMGRDHAVHQQIVDRRLAGGAPATPEAYARGLEEWHQLPGSVVRPPTDERPAAEGNKDNKQDDDEGKKENLP